MVKSAEVRYMPWGTTRYTSGTNPSGYYFTGQRWESSIGLYFYNARWYDPSAGRFIQADTIVPGAGNPQAYDRYAYVLNNPLKYVDPTGHATCEDMPWECDAEGNWLDDGPAYSTTSSSLVIFNSCPTCSWTIEEMTTITLAARQEAIQYAIILRIIIQQENQRMPLYGEDPIPLISPTEAFLLVRGGPVNFGRIGPSCSEYFSDNTYSCWGTSISPTHVFVFSNAPPSGVAKYPQFATHELGHGFDELINWQGRNNIPFQTNILTARKLGLYTNGGWQQSVENTNYELFADTYIAWIYNHYVNSPEGRALEYFMNTNMVDWFTSILANGNR
jgi:RHS repeat-associated protein